MTWEWYEWSSVEDFDLWHEAIKNELGIPRLSVDRRGNSCDPVITHYTQAIETEGKAIAMVENELAEGLMLTELRPPKLTNDIVS